MKLIIPSTDTIQATDARLIRLAEFLGISWEPLLLEKQGDSREISADKVFRAHGDCLAVNPNVLKEWTGGILPPDFASCLNSRFRYLLVHGITTDPFCEHLIRDLSCNKLHSIRPILDSGQEYEVASDYRDVCGSFSGISLGPVNPSNDLIFSVETGNTAVRTPISIGRDPFMAVMKRGETEILFLASTDTVDVNREIWDVPFSEYFSRFMPHAMALRYIFGELCWHPGEQYASFIIDDPLLRSKYGYLDFGSLLSMTKEYNFSTTIAFIPHNYRRNSKRIIQMFRQNSDRLAICFHGNDHTAAELASTEYCRLNTMLRIAEARMNIHTSESGLFCPKVMVFPHETFSIEAMEVLKSRNFVAAVTSDPHPAGRDLTITLAELAQPALHQFGEFPLFLRRYVGQVKKQDIAFNLFFGKPILIVEHHGVFRKPESLIETITMINETARNIHWCDLETAVINSILRRRTPDGCNHIHAFSGTTRIVNNRDSRQRVLVDWNHSRKCAPVQQILQDNTTEHSFEVSDSGIRLSVEMAPHSSHKFAVVYRNEFPSLRGLGFRWRGRAFTRRRLSELRDNYLSKNQYALNFATAFRRRMLA